MSGRPAAGPAPEGEPPGATGVFETVRLAAGQPVFWREHFDRFAAGCAHFGLEQAPSEAAVRAAAAAALRRSGIAAGVLRWSAWRDPAGGEAWHLRVEGPRPHQLAPAWRVGVSPLALPPPDAATPHKHLGRGRWREALAAGRAAGWDEVLLGDGAGGIVEGAISNLFCVREGVVLTPGAAEGPLPGIIRAKVLALARAEGLAVREGRVAAAELRNAAEVFLTDSLVAVRPVAWLEGRSLPAPGPVTARLQAAWGRRQGAEA